MMVDIFAHCYPPEYYRWMVAHSDANGYMQKPIRAIPVLVDVEERLDLMACFPGYAQIPSLVSPSIESLGCPEQSITAARVANDGMAAMCLAPDDREKILWRYAARLLCLNLPSSGTFVREGLHPQ